VDPQPHHLALLACAACGYILVKCVLSVLAVRIQLEIQRHELVREAKRRRLEYLAQLAERQGTGVIVEDHPEL
jgi:hypothetical protein